MRDFVIRKIVGMLNAEVDSALGADIKANHIVRALEAMLVALAIDVLREAVAAALDTVFSVSGHSIPDLILVVAYA